MRRVALWLCMNANASPPTESGRVKGVPSLEVLKSKIIGTHIAMTLTFNKFDSYKFATEFSPGQVTHIYPGGGTGGTSSGQPRSETWVRGERLGGGAFGTVWREKCVSNGVFRAVKQIHKSKARLQELEALIKMSEVMFLRNIKYIIFNMYYNVGLVPPPLCSILGMVHERRGLFSSNGVHAMRRPWRIHEG